MRNSIMHATETSGDRLVTCVFNLRPALLALTVVGPMIFGAGCSMNRGGMAMPSLGPQRVQPPSTGSYSSTDNYYNGPAVTANDPAGSQLQTRLAQGNAGYWDQNVSQASYVERTAPQSSSTSQYGPSNELRPSTDNGSRQRMNLRGLPATDLTNQQTSNNSTNVPLAEDFVMVSDSANGKSLTGTTTMRGQSSPTAATSTAANTKNSTSDTLPSKETVRAMIDPNATSNSKPAATNATEPAKNPLVWRTPGSM